MNKNLYLKIYEYFNSHIKMKRAINLLNNVFTCSVFLAYFAFLICLFIQKEEKLLVYVLIPAISFVVLSVFRYFYNAPRPYEKWTELKRGENTKKGMSFPSRHTFSALIISFMFFDYCKLLGGVFLIISLLIALFRVLLLKHFLKDVLVSMICAILINFAFIFFA